VSRAATISVVLASRNGARWISEQLASIEAQTRRPDQLVVSDDGSTDGTRELVTAFAERSPLHVVVLDGPQTGLADNFWNAVQHANGDLIAWADQDDVWATAKLEVCERAIYAHEALFVSHSSTVVDDRRRPLGSRYPDYDRLRCLEPLQGDPWHVPSGFASVFRRGLLDEVSWHSRPISHQTGRTMNHDHAVSLVAFAQGRRLELPDVLAEYRQHDANAAGAPRLTRLEGLQLALAVGADEFARLVPVASEYGRYAAAAQGAVPETAHYFERLVARCGLRARAYRRHGAARLRSLGRAASSGVYSARDSGGFGGLALCKDLAASGLDVIGYEPVR
jgi:glycosyltransferase involved in cell wall biosynthesis